LGGMCPEKTRDPNNHLRLAQKEKTQKNPQKEGEKAIWETKFCADLRGVEESPAPKRATEIGPRKVKEGENQGARWGRHAHLPRKRAPRIRNL